MSCLSDWDMPDTPTWLPVADEIDERHYSFDATALPDGLYRFRLRAADRDGNSLEEALLAFAFLLAAFAVMLRDDARFDPAAISAWCENVMPRHHVPRFWKEVDGFARTPSQRIRKDLLDRSLPAAFDREHSRTGA